MAIPRLAPVLALAVFLTLLLAACDSGPVPTATPIAAPTNTAAPTPTGTARSAEPSPTTATTTEGAGWAPTIKWRGGDRYLLGVNYPYHKYGNDFGGNAWGSYGVHDPATYKEVESDFATLSEAGVHTVRWFVFADARAGVKWDASGMPTGLDEFVAQDLDAALELAQKHNISLNLVLLDFTFVWNATTENGVQLGGHSGVLATPEGQQALLRNVFEPVLSRYAHHPSILSWEVMNEPEWTLIDAGTVDRSKISQPLTLATFRSFAKMTVDAIHNIAGTYATIGSADAKWARNWVGLGLDYYQIHFYDWMSSYSTDNLFATRAAALGLDRPVVVGEFPADHSTVVDLRKYLDTWYQSGYAGAWSWSYRGDTMWGSPDERVMKEWADIYKGATEIPSAP